MKRFIYAYIGLLIGLCSLTANAQTGTGSIFDTPVEERDSVWQAKRDSLAKLHRDNGNYSIDIECIGDVMTGYDIMFDTLGCHSFYSAGSSLSPRWVKRYKMYHVDNAMHKVRQVVVLREKWPNTPTEILADNGGVKLAAVTPREYIELDRTDAIYGEEWDICYPKGYTREDSLPNVPGYEMVVLERGYETLDRFGTDYYLHTKEIMTFADTIQGKPAKFLCAAWNPVIGRADYISGKFRYESAVPSNFIVGRRDKNDYWWRKYFDDLRQQQKARARRQRMWTASI